MKVGIITLYRGNRNYGGLLQAYALVRILKDMGYEAEIIDYEHDKQSYLLNRMKNLGLAKTMAFVTRKAYSKAVFLANKGARKQVRVRDSLLFDFERAIPHSQLVSAATIDEQVRGYDALVCGSDQIWNPGLWDRNMFLDMEGYEGRRIAYAASVGRSFLSEYERAYIASHAQVLDAVSVREESAVDLLQPLLSQKVLSVLDPTLLIPRDEWIAFARVPKGIPDHYAFSFFIDDSSTAKRDFYGAIDGQLPIVTIPHLQSGYKASDTRYSDIQLYEIGPREWVWLMLHAEYVATDSFHATAFAVNLYKSFACYARGSSRDSQTINARLIDLLGMFGLEQRLVQADGSVRQMYGVALDSAAIESELESRRVESIAFLIDGLDNAKEQSRQSLQHAEEKQWT